METKYFFTKDFKIKISAYPVAQVENEQHQIYDIYINGGCVAVGVPITMYNELFKIFGYV